MLSQARNQHREPDYDEFSCDSRALKNQSIEPENTCLYE